MRVKGLKIGPGANLWGADLRGADLGGADLRETNLGGADLRETNLRGANLWVADLRETNLRGADLRVADLRGANLRGADLRETNLRVANLPAPTEVLLANWGKLSDDLTSDLMAYDASCHPDPSAFDRWALGGSCPYEGIRVQRACFFQEAKKLWRPDRVLRRPYDLMVDVIRQACADSDFHEGGEEGK